MSTLSIHWGAAQQALGISFVTSIVVFFITGSLMSKFDRSYDNDTMMISWHTMVAGLAVANAVSVLGGLFSGISTTLFIIVGVILLLAIVIPVLIINGRL